MTLSLLANVLLCALLVTAIVLGVIFSRRLERLRVAQQELTGLGERFTEATAKAEAGLRDLRKTAEAEGAALQQRIDRIEGLKDDLMFLIGKASTTADRLERAIGAARTAAAPVLRSVDRDREPRPTRHQALAETAGGSEAASRGKALSRAGQELLRTLQGVR